MASNHNSPDLIELDALFQGREKFGTELLQDLSTRSTSGKEVRPSSRPRSSLTCLGSDCSSVTSAASRTPATGWTYRRLPTSPNQQLTTGKRMKQTSFNKRRPLLYYFASCLFIDFFYKVRHAQLYSFAAQPYAASTSC